MNDPVDLTPLRTALETDDLDGYLIDADASDSDQRYVSGFTAPDPYQTLVTQDGVHLLVSGLEYGRAESEAAADSVSRLSAYDYHEHRAEHGPYGGKLHTLAAFLADHDVESVAVPRSFPTGTADGLREQGLTVTVESEGIVEGIRATKTPWEVNQIRATQQANEAAMATAERLIASAEIDDDGGLVLDGTPLTSERVTEEIEVTLLRHGCGLDDTIVACAADGADPHDRGSGQLTANDLIVIDIFPRDKETGYFGDMTRTFARGEPSEEMERRYEVTREAYEAGLEAVEPGVTGEAVHDVVCDVIEDAGYETLRSDPNAETGFIHSTGHGVGLDIHEEPRVSPSGGELEPGHVISIEPGIYDPAVGGVRIEDLVVVTEDGYENLTEYRVGLEPVAA
ncbi:peptidase M24 family protein (homolog to Xaa-Pro dipeptidase) [Natrialba magadii ATCC 43099]|uniref:Peptidase M24 n=1 Tax=Natrialba magadii (strain ATCC 43099 / DSM 3394 / CCM 3739 / CIP 104546 / IAM 13178 / JCM 8861 / NBRC 102185 / NCIMB 2190 / MS3) TaxID=547559 RepID=D3SXK3_NATMM|nr:Xaa-Pro peptidase family protein [Natrialba magadii]ADD05952.1 peptidase M24 family protein (homolog to Xaa-Pro dipeptidase) [Natrialba magadii ATCC 43099]ELY30540.1 peptidase M24 [Natrialba magadii ATCC 43099]